MERDEFWSFLAFVDGRALRRGDEDAALAPMIAQLARLPEAKLFGFEEQLAQVLYALDSRAHAAAAGESSDSPDGVLYARCYVVARGRAHYDKVLADPAQMPRTANEWCETLLYAAQDAWTQATGRPTDDWDCATTVSYETGSNTARW